MADLHIKVTGDGVVVFPLIGGEKQPSYHLQDGEEQSFPLFPGTSILISDPQDALDAVLILDDLTITDGGLARAQTLYAAYRAERNLKLEEDEHLDEWDSLSSDVQSAWLVVAAA